MHRSSCLMCQKSGPQLAVKGKGTCTTKYVTFGISGALRCAKSYWNRTRNHPEACVPVEHRLLLRSGSGSAVMWAVSCCVPAPLMPPPASSVGPQHRLSLGRSGSSSCFQSDLVEPMLFGTCPVVAYAT